MIIWRGMGILAPIIFAIVYFIIYWILNLFLSPNLYHGWFVYVGAILAGIATWRSGSSINREVYQAQRSNPHAEIYSHSLFFLPMEIWAIPFTCAALAFGFINTSKVNDKKIANEIRIEKQNKDFENKIHLLDSLILNPEIGDYYSGSFKAKKNERSIKRDKHFSLALRVADFNDTQIQFYCPLNDPRSSNVRLYYKRDLVELFSKSREAGYYTWVDKERIAKAITRVSNTSTLAEVSIPKLVPNNPISIADIWRMNGPKLEVTSKSWNDSRVSLLLRNNGLPFTINAIQYKGEKVSWKKYMPISNVKQIGVDYTKDNTIRMNQKFYIQANLYSSVAVPHIELFGVDSMERKYRIDIKKEGEEVLIEKTEI